MKKITALIFLILMLIITSCANSSETSSLKSIASQNSKTENNVNEVKSKVESTDQNISYLDKLKNGDKTTIVFLGDSITEQNMTTNGFPNHVTLLRFDLNKRYSGQVNVINAGIGGQVVDQMRARIYKDVLDHNPDLIVISTGINDCLYLPLIQFKDEYNLMIQEILKQSDSEIIIRTPNPTLDPDFNKEMENYISATQEIALKYDLVYFDLYSIMQKEIKDGEIIQEEIMFDAVHPNELGHEYIFEKFKSYIMPTDSPDPNKDQ